MFSKDSSPKSAIKNIVTLNAYTDKKYIYKSDTFKPLNKLSYNTSNFITSYISNKDLISTSVSISRSIANEDISGILDIKAYEELGLDQATNYIISSVESEHSGEDREYHIFVAEPEVLDELYLPIKTETKYIDLIIPAPLLYKVLYKKEILQDSGTHCFIYFTKLDAFVTFYKDGEFLYSKSIDFSLEHIYDKYCELVGEKIDEKEFYNILESEGLKTSNNEYQQNFMKIFSEVFITINDIIIYTKRAFQLDTIDHMFIGSVQGPIIGLDEYSQNYLGLHSADFNFNFDINNDEWYTDQLQYLMLLNSLDYMETQENIINLSNYPRPPSFLNRASGQFIVSTFAAISVGVGYPLVFLVGSYINDAKIYGLTIEDKKLTQETTKYKKIIKEKTSQISLLDAKIGRLSTQYSGKSKTLISIYDKKVNYRLKSATLYTIAENLDRFDVKVSNILTDNDKIWLSLVSVDDRKITEVIKYISDKHFDDINEIDIEIIEKDPVSNYYKGLLMLELK